MPSDTQVIYSMMRVGRIHPPNKQVLRDISLGFYYGAKIGVLGLNGAGKSTLLRIIAGLDTDYVGEIAMSKGYSVGLLEQEPQLDPQKTVIEVIREGVQPITALLQRFDEVNAKFAEPEADFEALISEQARLQEALDKVDAWNLDSHLELAMDALRCPPADTPIQVLSGGERRRAGPFRQGDSQCEPTAGSYVRRGWRYWPSPWAWQPSHRPPRSRLRPNGCKRRSSAV